MDKKNYTFAQTACLLIVAFLWSYSGNAQGANCTANAGGNKVVCGNTTTLTGAVGNILGTLNSPLWSFVSGPVIPAIVSPDSLTTNITNMTADGVYTFRLTRNCGTGIATSDVTVTAHPRPAGFTAGPDITNICATTGTTTLAGAIPAGFTGAWRTVNIYSLNRFSTTVSTNAQFSSTTVATPVFSLVNKSTHEIDPSYYAILKITSLDGVCSYEDTAVVRFIPNPIINPAAITTRCYDSSNNSPEQFYFSLSQAPFFATAITGAAGTPAAGTTVSLTPVSQPAGGAVAFNRIDNNVVYLNGVTVTGTYVFTLTVTNACGTYTTPNITYIYPGARPHIVNFQPVGHGLPEQLVLYSSAGSGGEVHCGIANTSTPENFYFSIDPLDPPTVITTVAATGIAPPGGFPTVSVAGAGTRNRVATVTPPAGGWRTGTYRFTVTASNPDGSCGFTQLYYIHVSDNSRPAISVPDISVCYPGTGAISATIPLPAIYKGGVNTSYFQDFSGYYDFSVVSKPAGSATPAYTTTNLRDLTTAGTTISNLDKAGDYVFRITARNGNGNVGPFLEQEYACSGIPSITQTFTVHVENPINANAGSSQTIPCSQSTALLANNPGTGTGLWTLVSAPAGSTPALSGNTIINPVLSGTNVSGAYKYRWTTTSPFGGCVSSDDVIVTVAAAPGSDFGDLTTTVWPVASAAQSSCMFTSSKPDNYNGTTVTTTSVWAGNQINTENATVNGGNAAANTDLYDDGLKAGSGAAAYITPGTSYPFALMLNANRAATTVYFRVWADWNADGNFTNDADATTGQGGNATYTGSAVVTTAGIAVPYNFNMTPPAGADPNYKIRVAVSNTAITDVYRSFGAATVLVLASGEIEDYSAPVPLCNAQSATAPALSRTSITSICPAVTADLSTITAANQNGSVRLTWHSAVPADNSNKLSAVTALGAGTYYAAFYDAANDCYSTATTTVAVTTPACFTLSGSVFHDANGNVIREAGEAFTSLPFPMYVYLVNSTGTITDSATVAADGSYRLNIAAGFAYTIALSSTRYPVGMDINTTPIVNTLPGKWRNTGERANGIIDGTADGLLSLPAVSGNLVNYNFGIEQAPTTDSKVYNVAESAFSNTPPSGYPSVAGYKSIPASSAALTGYTTGGSLSGSDPEDCSGAGTCNAGSTFAITGINSNTKLYYDFGAAGVQGINVNAGIVLIPDFDPSKLIIYGSKGTGTAGSPVGFTCALVDKAGILGNTAGYSIRTAEPLPVNLAYFNAVKEHNTVRLDWLFYNEKEIKGFEVERSIDAQRWYLLGFKACNGNTTETACEYTDESPLPGNNYYRLKQTDHDGSFRYSLVRSVNFDGAGILLSPNPVTNELTISGLSGTGRLILENVHGMVLKTQQISGTTEKVSLTDLPSGIYFIILKKNGGNTESYRILKK